MLYKAKTKTQIPFFSIINLSAVSLTHEQTRNKNTIKLKRGALVQNGVKHMGLVADCPKQCIRVHKPLLAKGPKRHQNQTNPPYYQKFKQTEIYY